MPDNEPDTGRNEPPAPPENLTREQMMAAMAGNMQDDRSRRRRPRRPENDEEELECDALVKNRPDTTFDDVAGNEEAKTELQEIARATQDRESYERFGAHLPKGILMTGKPGCGKTYLTGALANTLKAPFYHVGVSNVTSMWFGQSEKNLQKIFDHAKKYCRGEIDIAQDGKVTKFDPDTYAADRERELFDNLISDEERDLEEISPEEQEECQGEIETRKRETTLRAVEARKKIREEIVAREAEVKNRHAIIFFDEMDALGAARENTPFQGGVSNRIVSVLLENMDGLESENRILVIGGTNRVLAMDSALRRAGRFDRIIKVKKPDQPARAKIFEIHFGKAQKRAQREFVRATYAELAIETKNLVGADIAEIVRKACQEQAKKWRDTSETSDKEALDYIDTEAVLKIIREYRVNLRKKEGESKGRIGFQTKPTGTRGGELVVEEEFQDDDDEDGEMEDGV